MALPLIEDFLLLPLRMKSIQDPDQGRFLEGRIRIRVNSIRIRNPGFGEMTALVCRYRDVFGNKVGAWTVWRGRGGVIQRRESKAFINCLKYYFLFKSAFLSYFLGKETDRGWGPFCPFPLNSPPVDYAYDCVIVALVSREYTELRHKYQGLPHGFFTRLLLKYYAEVKLSVSLQAQPIYPNIIQLIQFEFRGILAIQTGSRCDQ